MSSRFWSGPLRTLATGLAAASSLLVLGCPRFIKDSDLELLRYEWKQTYLTEKSETVRGLGDYYFETSGCEYSPSCAEQACVRYLFKCEDACLKEQVHCRRSSYERARAMTLPERLAAYADMYSNLDQCLSVLDKRAQMEIELPGRYTRSLEKDWLTADANWACPLHLEEEELKEYWQHVRRLGFDYDAGFGALYRIRQEAVGFSSERECRDWADDFIPRVIDKKHPHEQCESWESIVDRRRRFALEVHERHGRRPFASRNHCVEWAFEKDSTANAFHTDALVWAQSYFDLCEGILSGAPPPEPLESTTAVASAGGTKRNTDAPAPDCEAELSEDLETVVTDEALIAVYAPAGMLAFETGGTIEFEPDEDKPGPCGADIDIGWVNVTFDGYPLEQRLAAAVYHFDLLVNPTPTHADEAQSGPLSWEITHWDVRDSENPDMWRAGWRKGDSQRDRRLFFATTTCGELTIDVVYVVQPAAWSRVLRTLEASVSKVKCLARRD